MVMTIEVQSPTRVDLAGGTLDCWPLYNFVGTCWTVNLSISVYTGVKIFVRDDSKIIINIQDLKYKKEFFSYSEFIGCPDHELKLVLAVLNYWPDESIGFELETYSQSPVGGGLGGSSSLVVSLLKGFGEAFDKKWQLNELVQVAHNIEARMLKTPTGTQDYVPAANPGLNLIRYDYEGLHVEQVDFDLEEFTSKMLIVFTGRSHHSGINNWQVLQDVINGDTQTLGTLKEIANISKKMKLACENQRWDELPSLFREEYRSRIALTPSFSSPEIIELEKMALNSGAEAVKICGAGGGGCVMIWCPPNRKSMIQETIVKGGFQVLDAVPLKK